MVNCRRLKYISRIYKLVFVLKMFSQGCGLSVTSRKVKEAGSKMRLIIKAELAEVFGLLPTVITVHSDRRRL